MFRQVLKYGVRNDMCENLKKKKGKGTGHKKYCCKQGNMTI